MPQPKARPSRLLSGRFDCQRNRRFFGDSLFCCFLLCMENVIYNELLRRGYSVDVGVVEIVERKEGKKVKKQCEIDFVVNVGSKKYYIQSALNVSDPTKMDSELRPLKNTNDFFKKIIVSKTSQKPWNDEDGILHLGLYEFLLNENALDL